MSSGTEAVVEDAAQARRIPVIVNKQTVELPEREMTGLEIKAEAISQGVDIQPNFQLSVKQGNRYEVVGDMQTIKVHRDEVFLAVAPDDNS